MSAHHGKGNAERASREDDVTNTPTSAKVMPTWKRYAKEAKTARVRQQTHGKIKRGCTTRNSMMIGTTSRNQGSLICALNGGGRPADPLWRSE